MTGSDRGGSARNSAPALPEGVATRVPVYRGMKRFDGQVMGVLPQPAGRAAALSFMDAIGEELAADARAVCRSGKAVMTGPLTQLSAEELRATGAVRRLGSYDKSRSNLALHPVEHAGVRKHVWAESQLELAHLRELQREGRFDWYDTQRVVLYWPVPNGRCIWHVPDIAAVDHQGQRWLMDVKNADALASSPQVRAQLLLTAQTCAHAGWGYRILSDLSRQRQALLSSFRNFRRPLPTELAAALNDAVHGHGAVLGQVVADAGGGPAGHEVAMHLLATGHLQADLDQPLNASTPVVWAEAR